jgi:hypothetical protein
VELVSVRFLGCSTRVDRGFAATLAKVETALAAQHAAEAPGMKFSAWHGIRGVGGYRAHGGMHSKGRAVDLNYSRNGYAVCRTVTPRGTVFGGEAVAASLTGTRAAFIAACARACLLARVPCDLSARKFGESTGSVWDRWHVVSDAVASHFAPYYQTTDDYDAGDADVRDGVIVPDQVAADYAAVRLPLVVGTPTQSPLLTRNPAKGIMDIPRAVAVAMCDVGGLRWGACDFGAASSGDIMHFDNASRIPSGA